MKTQFSDSELSAALSKHEAKAKKLISDKTEWAKFVEKVRVWLEGKKTVPVIGSVIDDILTIIDLVTDYVSGNYTAVPLTSIISATAALIYLVSPIDLIPDFIPIVGLLDDVAVISLVLTLGVGNDLKKYRTWRAEKHQEKVNALVVIEAKEIAKKLAQRPLVCAFYEQEKQQIGFIIGDKDSKKPPIDSKLEIAGVSSSVLELIQEPTGIIKFYQDALNTADITWSALGPKPLIKKEDLEEYAGCYYLETEED